MAKYRVTSLCRMEEYVTVDVEADTELQAELAAEQAIEAMSMDEIFAVAALEILDDGEIDIIDSEPSPA